MSKPLISIVVPIYKVEEYLDNCIESIISQKYENLEIILVNDGSPDNCGKIMEEYAKKDSRIVNIYKENGGLSDARNAGMNVATGKYICFLDSDDYVENNMFLDFEKHFGDNNIDVFIWGYYVDNIEKSDKLIKRTIENFDYNGIFHDKEKINQDTLKKFGYAWNKLYRLNYLKDNNFQFEKGLSLMEDTEFNSRVLQNANIYISNGIYNHYIQRERETLGNKKYDNLLELNIRFCNCHTELLEAWKVSKEKIEEIEVKDYMLILKGHIWNIIFCDKTYLSKRQQLAKLIQNEKIKKFLTKSKYKGLKERIFSFLIKHKMITMLKLYYNKKLKNKI